MWVNSLLEEVCQHSAMQKGHFTKPDSRFVTVVTQNCVCKVDYYIAILKVVCKAHTFQPFNLKCQLCRQKAVRTLLNFAVVAPFFPSQCNVVCECQSSALKRNILWNTFFKKRKEEKTIFGFELVCIYYTHTKNNQLPHSLVRTEGTHIWLNSRQWKPLTTL